MMMKEQDAPLLALKTKLRWKSMQKHAHALPARDGS
jgi:hypothetical protein